GHMSALRSTQHNTRGGSRLTEQKALTVIPWSRPEASRAVSTVTPVVKRPSVLRNVAASIMSVGTLSGGKQAEKIAHRQDFVRRHEVAGDTDEQIGHVLSLAECGRCAIHEGGDRNREGDETLDPPFPGERATSLGVVCCECGVGIAR